MSDISTAVLARIVEALKQHPDAAVISLALGVGVPATLMSDKNAFLTAGLTVFLVVAYIALRVLHYYMVQRDAEKQVSSRLPQSRSTRRSGSKPGQKKAKN